MLNASRLWADPYDSANQGRFTTWGDEKGFQVFLGRMRLDSILYDQIVVNDQALVDGVFFLDAARRGLLSELPWSRIEFRSRATTFSECFSKTFQRPNCENLASVWLSAPVNDEASRLVSVGLENVPAKSARSPESLTPVLIDLGLDKTIAERLLVSWQKLSRYIDENDIRLTPWRPVFEFEKFISLARDEARAALQTKLGRETFASIWSNRDSRNAVRSLLTNAYRHASWSEMRDISTIDTWYNFAYQATLAHQHGCNGVEVSVTEACWPYSETQLPIKSVFENLNHQDIYKVPDDFLLAFGNIPRVVVDATFQRKNPVTDRIREWRSARLIDPRSARDSFKRAMEVLVRWVFNETLTSSDDELTKVGTNLTGTLAGYFVGDHLGKRLDRGLTRRVFFSTTTAAIAAIATDATLATTIEDKLDPAKRTAESIVRMEETRAVA